MEISAESIDGKICKISSGSSKQYSVGNPTTGGAKCGLGHSGSGEHQLKDFRTEVLEKGKGWPDSGNTSAEAGDNAKAVAKDLTKLTTEEKTIVAGLLAKTTARTLAVIP
ncbi:hypothetical protein ANAPH2_00689 [Anaplasma phagocytophilum]|nr:hypothetical protein ANAPH2_00689 [Anaplasma phagocytophilum]